MLHNLFHSPSRHVIQQPSATGRRKRAKQPQRQRRWLFLERLEDRRLLATVSIDDVSVPEGNVGATPAVFSVTLDTPSLSTVTVNYNIALGGTAAASDFVATSGVVTFPPGQTQQQITIDVAGDTQMERHETFQVILTDPTNAILYDNLGLGTIVDEDVEAIYTTPTGPLDITWDGDGIKHFKRPESTSDAAAGTAIDPDGRVLVFGNYPGVRSSEAFVVRYLPNGLPDASFNGAAGIASLQRPNGTGSLGVFGGAVYASGPDRGKVLVHASYHSFTSDILVARFNVDGSLDTSFGPGGAGYVQFDSGSWNDNPYDIAIYESGQHAGKFVVVGSANVLSVAATGLIARYTAAGTLDPTFGSGGTLTYRQTYNDGAAQTDDATDFDRVLIDSTGMLMISGTTGRPGTYNVGTTGRISTAALWRFDNIGNLVASFGTGGVAFSPLDSYSGAVNDLAIQSDGKIVQQVVHVNVSPRLAMARFTPGGVLDTSFGVDGNGMVTSNSFGVARTLSLDASDRILVGGETGNFGGGHFFVSRFSRDGVLDNIFDPVQLDGSISPALDSFGYYYNLRGAVLNSDGNLLLAGHRSPPYSDLGPPEMSAVRYETARGDLSVTMTGPTAPVPGGTTIAYTITVRNTGDDAVFASLRDVLPTGLTFVSLTTPSGWAYSAPAVGSNGTVTAATRNLRASDGDQVFTLTVVVAKLSGDTNTVSVSSATLDYVSANNTATFVINPTCIAPISWWQAEGDANDFVDGNHGSPQNGVAYATGKVEQAFSLNGGSYVSVPSAANLNFTSALTIEGWVNLSTNNFNNGLVFKGPLTGSQGVYSLGFYTGGSNQLSFRLNGGAGQVTGATSLTVGQWYHVAAVYDQVSARIYVDGVLDGSQAYTSAVATNNDSLIIGGYFSPGYLFQGLIDEASVYNRALTQQYIQSVVAAGSSGKCANTPPVGVDDTYSVNEDPTAPGLGVAAPGVLANDTDAEMDSLTAVLISGPANGSLTLNTDGSFLYTPTANFNGTDSFRYQANDGEDNSATTTVTITVTEVNDSPTANADSATVAEDSVANVIIVLANDSKGPANESGQTLTVISASAAHGSVSINANGTLSYSPAADYNGPDTISYTIRDNGTTSGAAALTADGSVSVTVTAVNDDAPVFTSAAAFSVPENTTAVGTNTATDADLPAQTVTFSITGGADAAKFSITSGGVLTFNAAPDYENPADAGTNNVYDVEVTADDNNGLTTVQAIAVTVTSVNDNAPVFTSAAAFNVPENTTAVGTTTATDADLPAQTVTFSITGGADAAKFSIASGGVLTFNAAPDFENPTDAGTDNVYEVQVLADDNNGLTTVQAITVTVTPVNDNAPIFTSAAAFSVPENTTAVGTTTAADADSPAQTVTFSISGGADAAKFSITSAGVLTFNAAPDYENPTDDGANNVYDVRVTAADGQGLTTLQAITVTVTPVNDNAPIANDDSAMTNQGTPVTINVVANDEDVDGDSLTVAAVTQGTNGAVVNNGNGTVTYTPNAAFSGTDSFSYTLSDGHGGTDIATVTLTVKSQSGAAKITGGGSIDSGVRNFGFVVQPASGGGFKGNLEFQDKSPGNNFNLKGTSITAISANGNRGTFSGTATKNGVGGFTFTVDVEDNGEPGAGVDKFRVRVFSGLTLVYDSSSFATKGGVVDKGGNIQIHKAGSKLTSAAPDGSSGTASSVEDSSALVSSAGQILVGLLRVSLHDDGGSVATESRARIDDALIVLNDAFGSWGLTLVVVDVASGEPADLQLEMAWTSVCGSAADGVLGCTTDTGDITLLKGWNWYTGADGGAVEAAQYDYQTIVTHELGHSVGLGHSTRADSVMYTTLATGVARRTLAAGDIAIDMDDDVGSSALMAAATGANSPNSLISDAQVPILQRAIIGFTLFDEDSTVLDLTLAEWSSSHNYSTRVGNFRNGGGAILTGSGVALKTNGLDRTVFDDGHKDILQEDNGRDWFFADLDGTEGDDDDDDKVKDKKSNELADLIFDLP